MKEYGDFVLLVFGINQILFVWIAINQYNIYKELKKENDLKEIE